MTPTVLGMSLSVGDDDVLDSVQPLCAVVLLKALTGDGELCYLTRATPGLTSVEALGMLRYAQQKLEHAMRTEWDGK